MHMTDRTFSLDPRADIAGTSLAAEVELAPAFLVERFGPPLPGDAFKVTGRYSFSGPSGDLFTVYEYKSTSAYADGDEDAPSPEEFWASAEEHEFSVGGRGDYEDGSAGPFVQWLLAEYRRWKAGRN